MSEILRATKLVGNCKTYSDSDSSYFASPDASAVEITAQAFHVEGIAENTNTHPVCQSCPIFLSPEIQSMGRNTIGVQCAGPEIYIEDGELELDGDVSAHVSEYCPPGRYNGNCGFCAEVKPDGRINFSIQKYSKQRKR